MKRIYASSGVKLLLYGLAVLSFLGAAYCAFAASLLAEEDCMPGQSYESSYAYRDVVFDHVIAAANLYRMDGEDLSALTFVQQQDRRSQREALEEAFSTDVSNFRFQILSSDGKTVLFSNFDRNMTFESLGIEPYYASVSEGQMTVNFPDGRHYYATAGSNHLFSNDVSYDNAYSGADSFAGKEDETYTLIVQTTWRSGEDSIYAPVPTSSAASYVIRYGVDHDYPVQDVLLDIHEWYIGMQDMFPLHMLCAAFCSLLALVFTIFLCRSAGYRRDREGIVLRLFDRIPYELVVLLLLGAGSCIWAVAGEFVYYSGYDDVVTMTAMAVIAACCAALGELLLMTTAVRVRAHVFRRNTIVGWIFRLCGDALGHLDLCWKFVLVYIGYEFFSLLLFTGSRAAGLFFLMAIVNFFLLLAACRWAVKFAAVRAGAEELSRGNLEYRINTLRLPPLLLDHANNLNHISDGMAAALEEQMKSERLKSELITNVSHDIKTPLTSIINYVDLIKAEQVDNAKVQEYIAVLDRQSARLKKLTNDLVEASKASSGAIHVELADVDACELLQQATGEYSERLSAGDLTPVFSLPETPVYIRADGALLWRVIDNILSNICKYALPGTRVYLSAETDGARLTIQAKNISRAPLNIPPDELMERFVRGDMSRNSEGSGLGLSIAQSLTELMGGTFDLEIDGDLFKACLTLPVIRKPHG